MASEYSLVFEWLGSVIIILMLRNCHSYVLPFEIRTGIQMVEPFAYHTKKSSIQVLGIQMVTVDH